MSSHVTEVSIRLRILKGQYLLFRQCAGKACYRGLDPIEDTERLLQAAIHWHLLGYRGLDPIEDTESFPVDPETQKQAIKGYRGLDPIEDTESYRLTRSSREGGKSVRNELKKLSNLGNEVDFAAARAICKE